MNMSCHLFWPALPEDERPFFNVISKVLAHWTVSHLPCDLFLYQIHRPL